MKDRDIIVYGEANWVGGIVLRIKATDRRTISLPLYLPERLNREAAERGMPFSALVAELVEDSLDPRILSYVGAIDDDLDLSMRVEEIPVRHLRSAQPSSAVEMDGPRP